MLLVDISILCHVSYVLYKKDQLPTGECQFHFVKKKKEILFCREVSALTFVSKYFILSMTLMLYLGCPVVLP